jgi:adenosylcobinamide-GDP ribazoletransferase
MKRQVHIFLNALMFYSRIPVPSWMTHNEEMLNKASIYFPVIGWIVGGIASLTFYGFNWLFPTEIALILSMICGILTTGAFHEDGFADVCDGFGGGWTKMKILDIMKDSRLGTYGAAGLGLILTLKFLSLKQLEPTLIPWVLMIAHPLSRFVALSFVYTHEYVRENEDSKAKPLAKKLSASELFIAFCFAVVPLLGYLFWFKSLEVLLVFLPLVLVKAYLARYFTKWIGGYTGDCLGATQQVSEVIIYLFFLALWKFI